MRKESRRMDERFALEVLDRAPYVTLSLVRPDGTPYGVPLSMARVDDRTLYFHCATEGEKLEAILSQPRVCLSAVTRCRPTVGPLDGSFSLQYRSAIAFGTARLVTDDRERVDALRAISRRFLPGHMDAFDQAVARSLGRVAVVRVTLSAPPVGKRKEYDEDGEEMTWGRTR